jgi:hypothetical protein
LALYLGKIEQLQGCKLGKAKLVPKERGKVGAEPKVNLSVFLDDG